MAPPLFNEAFIIIRVDNKGQPVNIIPYDENAATYVAVSISICRGMLKTSRVKDAFKKFAEAYDPKLPKDGIVETFINKILERFPLVFVDNSMENPDLIACHFRRAWRDEGYGFDPRKQGILINGPKVHKMCIAGIGAESSQDPDSKVSKRFRVFLFTFAKSFMHELAHIFVTSLGPTGKTRTPPHIRGSEEGDDPTGEAGRYIENLIFGGRVIIIRNNAEGEGQAGICFLANQDGAYQILQQTIDEIIKYQFDFPISRLGPQITDTERTLGFHLPMKFASGDPMDAPGTRQLLAPHEANLVRWDEAVDDLIKGNPNAETFSEEQESVMHEVPFNPSLRIEPKLRA